MRYLLAGQHFPEGRPNTDWHRYYELHFLKITMLESFLFPVDLEANFFSFLS